MITKNRYPPEPMGYTASYGQQGVSLLALWRRLMRQKLLFLLITLLTSLLAAWITFSIPPTYRAVATVQIEKEAAQVVEFGKIGNTTPDLGEQDAFFRTQYEQLKSAKLAQQVVEKLDLGQRLYEAERLRKKSWLMEQKDNLLLWLKSTLRQLLVALGIVSPEEKEALSGMSGYIKNFQEGLYVEPIEKTHLVKIFFESTDADISAQVVNTLIDEFIKDHAKSQNETGHLASEFLTQEMDKARKRLTDSETKLVKYAKRNDILEVNNSQAIQEKKLGELYTALADAQRNRIQTESLMLQGDQNQQTVQVVSNPVVDSLKQQLATLEAEYQDKAKIFKPAYPDMQQLSQQIAVLKNKLASETTQVKTTNQTGLQTNYKAAKKLEDDLQRDLDDYKAELGGLRDRSIEYDAIKREVEVSRNLYDGLLQRMKEVGVATQVVPSNIRIVDRATKPIDIFRPQRKVNLIIGGVLGLLLGAGLALLRESFSQKLDSVDELKNISELPVVGSIPRSRMRSESELALISARDLGSPLAEAYRIAAANLRFAGVSGTLPHSTVVTSVNPSEGKSTSSVNLALSLAQMGTKVLLIDADLRRPTIHSKMNLTNAQGLSEYLLDKSSLAAITQSVPEVSGLYVISAGSALGDPVKLISSTQMKQLLNLSTKHFDAVIVDAPPVTGFADALLLASMTESTLLVANEKTIDRRKLLATIEQLKRASKHILGFLVVQTKEGVANDRYYKRYTRVRKSATTPPKPAKKGLNLVS